jgi:hypothetical protein
MEQPAQTPNIPSGYTEVTRHSEQLVLGPESIPWLDEPAKFDMVLCKLQGGSEFLLASALKTHDELMDNAEAMTEQQSESSNNMFYSRVAGYIQNGNNSPLVETFPNPATSFPIKVLRNKSGQRVYFGVMKDEASDRTIVLKLGACDKNKQDNVTGVLTSSSRRTHRKKSTK